MSGFSAKSGFKKLDEKDPVFEDFLEFALNCLIVYAPDWKKTKFWMRVKHQLVVQCF